MQAVESNSNRDCLCSLTQRSQIEILCSEKEVPFFQESPLKAPDTDPGSGWRQKLCARAQSALRVKRSFVCVWVCVCVCVYVGVYVCMCFLVCVFVCLSLFVCV